MIATVTDLATGQHFSYEGTQIVVYPLCPPSKHEAVHEEPAGHRCSIGAMQKGWVCWMQVDQNVWHPLRVDRLTPEGE
jgi:hypothetical protein